MLLQHLVSKQIASCPLYYSKRKINMGDEEIFSNAFYSTAPINEKVTVIPLRNNQFYWMLSLDIGNRESNSNLNSYAKLAPYEDNEGDLVDCCELEDNFEINPTKSGKYITSFYVPQALHSTIIGPRGIKLRELQERTNTLIKVPRPDESAIVKITGDSERSVASARTQIALLLLTRREKLSITHFITIPLYSPEIEKNFNQFKQEILGGPSTRGIDESIFQNCNKLHLTITTLTLLDDREIEEANIAFGKCQESLRNYFNGKTPKILLKGVEIMNDDPHNVDVLYGKVCLDNDETNLLQNFANEILDKFSRTGLVRKQYDNVKLHVTLMNSLFRKSDDGFFNASEKQSKRESFDASYILNKYQNFYFGKVNLNEIHFSIRFTTSKNGYYDNLSIVTLNSN